MRTLKLLLLTLAGACLGCALQAQTPPTLSFQANVLWRPIRQYEYWSHRVDLGVRYRPCVLQGMFCGHIGALVIAENPFTIGTGGTNTAHFGVGVDMGNSEARLGFSLGQFVQHSNIGVLQYYRFLAVGIEHRGKWDGLLESQFFQFDMNAEGPAVHYVRAKLRIEVVTWELNVIELKPSHTEFLTGTMTFNVGHGFYASVGNAPILYPVAPSPSKLIPMGYLGLGWRLVK